MSIVSNASPLINMARIQQLDLLRRLYGELRVVGVGQADAGGLRRQAEAGRVPHERGAARFGGDLQARQVLAFEQAGDEAESGVPIRVVEGNGLNQHAGHAARLDAHDAHAAWPVRAAEDGTDRGKIAGRAQTHASLER